MSDEPIPDARVILGAPERRRVRGSAMLGLPAGLVLLVCLALPGYDDCGSASIVGADAGLLPPCIAGIAIALAIVLTGRRARGIGFLLLPLVLALPWLGTYALFASHTLIGLALKLAATWWLACAIAFAMSERPPAPPRSGAAIAMAVIALASYAAIALWVPSAPPPVPRPAPDADGGGDLPQWAHDLGRFLQAESKR